MSDNQQQQQENGGEDYVGIQSRLTQLTDNLLPKETMNSDQVRPTIEINNNTQNMEFFHHDLQGTTDNPYERHKSEHQENMRKQSTSSHSARKEKVVEEIKEEFPDKKKQDPHEQKPSQPDPEKPKVINPTKKLMQYLKAEWVNFALGMVALFAGTFGIFVVPLYVGWVITDLTNVPPDYDSINKLCIQLAIIIFVSSIFVMIRGYMFNVISERIAKNLRQDIYNSIVNKDIAFFDNRKTGDLLSRLNSDTSVIQDGLSTNVSMFVRSFVFIILSFIILFYISWALTLATLGTISPLVAFGVFYGKAMKNTQKKIQDSKAKTSTIAEESFSNIRTVKAFATEHEESHRYEIYNDQVYQLGKYKAKWYGVFNFIANFFGYGSMCVIIYLGANLYKQGKIDIGDITSFLLYMMQLLLNIMLLASVLGSVMTVIGASYKIVEIMEYKPDINTTGGIELEKYCRGEIKLQDVKFHYPTKKDVQILKGVTINIEKNKVVALVGQSVRQGCGKSSIISMIERFYDPCEGDVYFDGKNIKELNPKWYHQQVAIVSQEPVLFSGTIKENIIYGYEDKATQEDLDRACRMANAYDFIHDKDLFPEGYGTIVGERGVKLSGGQKQRIAIARALIRRPKVLLLDEATSALDAESEHQVQKALDELIKSGEQTIIVIAHRLSTIRDADEIIVIRKGEIAERGSHEELIKKGGVYKQLVERQLMALQLDEEEDESK